MKKGILFLTAGLLLAAALPLAEAAPPKRNCGSRCELDYETCMKSAQSKSARKSCKASRKLCKRVCY